MTRSPRIPEAKILAYLQTNPYVSLQGAADALGTTYNALRMRLHKLEKMGKVRKLPVKYEVVCAEPQAEPPTHP